jgi:branched-chain amino acid transport system substrate-binding protein
MLRLLAALFCFSAFTFGAAFSHAEIVVAVAGPMKGQYAALGEQITLGAATAVADLNAAGGINGEQIRMLTEDDNCDARQAVAAAERLVVQNVRLVIGHYCSGASIAAAPTYAKAGILMLSPSSTSPKFTDEGTWNTNRLVARDDAQGSFAGAAVAKAFAGKSIAILNDGSAFGKSLALRFKAALNAAGQSEKLDIAYKPGLNSYDEQVNAILAANVDLIYVGGYPQEAGTIIRSLRELASNAVLVGGDPLLVEQFWTVAGTAGEGAYATFMRDPLKFERAQALIARLNAAGTPPEGFALHAYASLEAYAAAVKATGSFDGRKASDWLRAGNGVDTVIGSVALDAQGDIKDPAFAWYRWSAGTFAEVPTFP